MVIARISELSPFEARGIQYTIATSVRLDDAENVLHSVSCYRMPLSRHSSLTCSMSPQPQRVPPHRRPPPQHHPSTAIFCDTLLLSPKANSPPEQALHQPLSASCRPRGWYDGPKDPWRFSALRRHPQAFIVLWACCIVHVSIRSTQCITASTTFKYRSKQFVEF